MKESITIKLRSQLDSYYPSWQDVVFDKGEAQDSLTMGIDRIISDNNLPVWITSEYKSMKDGGWTKSEVNQGFNRVYRIILKEDRKLPDSLINQISLLPNVESVKPIEFAQIHLPNHSAESYSGSQSVFYNNDDVLKIAHSYSKGNKEIKIAVLDTGIYREHSEFNPARISQGFDYVNIIDGHKKFVGDFLEIDDSPNDEVGHGTHVSGILGAQGRKMSTGVVPDCTIVPIKVLGSYKKEGGTIGAGTVGDINAGIKYAVDQGVDVINMSLGIKHEGGGLPHERVIDYAKENGVTVVAASGNDGTRELYFPGANPYVLAVGATNNSGGVANFSTYGPHISFVAPGTNIYSTYVDNKYAYSSGTSQASPFVAGTIALLKSYALKEKGKKLSDSFIKHILLSTADRSTSKLKTTKEGFGAINLPDALKLLRYQLN